MSRKDKIAEVDALHPSIEFIEERTLAGVKTLINTKKQDNLMQVKAFWARCEADGTLDDLRKMGTDGMLYSCSTGFGKHEYNYWICAKIDEDAEVGFETICALACEYAVFFCEGSAHENMQNLWKRIYNGWFPKSGYLHMDAPEVECYPAGDMYSPCYNCEIQVPVVIAPVRKLPSRSGSMARMLGALVGLGLGAVLGSRMSNSFIGIIIGLAIGIYGGDLAKRKIEEREARKAENETSMELNDGDDEEE